MACKTRDSPVIQGQARWHVHCGRDVHRVGEKRIDLMATAASPDTARGLRKRVISLSSLPQGGFRGIRLPITGFCLGFFPRRDSPQQEDNYNDPDPESGAIVGRRSSDNKGCGG